MPRLEDELRLAMREETAALFSAPDLTDRIVRRARRRHTRRTWTVAVAAVMAVVAVVVPAVFLNGRGQEIAGRQTTFEGLTVTYVPEGVTADGTAALGYDGIQRRWTGGGDRWMQVEAVRGSEAKSLDDLEKVSWPVGTRLTEVRTTRIGDLEGRAGRVESAKDSVSRGRVAMWLIRPGFGVRVHVGEGLAGELERIAEGVLPQAPPSARGDSVDGIGVTHLPPGAERLDDGTDVGMGRGWVSTSARWRTGAGEILVTVLRGPGGAEASESFLGLVARPPWQVGDRMRAVVGRERRELLIAEIGLTVRVTVPSKLGDELDGIIAGLRLPTIRPSGKPVVPDEALCGTPPAPRSGRALSGLRAVPGVPIGYTPEGLTMGETFTDLESLTRTDLKVYGYAWHNGLDATEPGFRRVSVGVVCGVESAEKLRALVDGAEPAVLGGRPAITWLSELSGGGPYVMWLAGGGAAIFVGGGPDDAGRPGTLRRVAESIT
ncbi:hypothetical protein [Streptosporangium sp. KLBMP 9127]|nr:hypothetical protein [Streptosporangium sp. KLBMP 9127]